MHSRPNTFKDRLERDLNSWKAHIYLIYISIVFSLVSFIVLYPLYGAENNISLIYESTLSGFLFFICGILMYTSLKYFFPSKDNFIKTVGILLSICAIHLYVVLNCYEYIYKASFDYQNKHEILLRFSINTIGFTVVLLCNTLQNYKREALESIERKEHSEKVLYEAELYNLRQQLQPHFLFNSLNSIVALIDLDPQQAVKMAQSLSDFLRGTIRNNEKQLSSFQDELEQMQRYLEIERFRFSDRLDLNFQLNYNQEDTLLVPSMISQPLLENAIKHGVFQSIGRTEVTIQVSLVKGYLIIKISNPIPSSQGNITAPKGVGFGLKSLSRRLFLIYGRTDLLEIARVENMYVATLKIPQNHESINS